MNTARSGEGREGECRKGEDREMQSKLVKKSGTVKTSHGKHKSKKYSI